MKRSSLNTATAPTWATASSIKTPGVVGRPGKCPGKNHSSPVSVQSPLARSPGSILTSRSIKKATASKAAPAPLDAPGSTPAVALRRGRQPVNPEDGFAAFVKQFKIGANVTGEVSAFTSHGAVITVTLKNGVPIECYAPTTSLGDPAPARARDVLKRGDQRTFRLVTVDSERRIAELALT